MLDGCSPKPIVDSGVVEKMSALNITKVSDGCDKTDGIYSMYTFNQT